MAATLDSPSRFERCTRCVSPCTLREIAIEEQGIAEQNPFDVLNSEQALCAMKHAGDAPEWERCRVYVRRIVYKHRDDMLEPDEVVQQAMEVIFTKLDAYQRKSKLTTWIHSIVFYTMANMIRTLRKQRHHEEELDAALTIETAIGDPEKCYETTEIWAAIEQGIMRYCEQIRPASRGRHARILHRALREGRKPEEIAEEFGVTKRLVYQILKKALQIVQETLHDIDAT